MLKYSLSWKVIVDKLSREFKSLFDFIAAWAKFPTPSYPKHLDFSVFVEEMIKLEMPTPHQWKVIENYGKTKYKLH